jgi:hypothetical protein
MSAMCKSLKQKKQRREQLASPLRTNFPTGTDTLLLSQNGLIQLIEHHSYVTIFKVLLDGQKAQSFSVPMRRPE